MARALKNALLSSILLMVSLLFAFALGEAALRALGYHGAPESEITNIVLIDDEVLNWRIKPNSIRRDGSLTYKFNSNGFRDLDHAVENADSKKRVVVLGDSVTVGYGVDSDETFTVALREQLAGAAEIINVSAGGLNTPQEVHLLEKEGLKYGPDAVVLNFVLNDCDFYSNHEGATEYFERKDSEIGLLGGIPVNPEFKRFLKSSALVYFVKTHVENLKGRITGEFSISYDYFHDIWSKPENRKKVADGFRALAELAERHSFTGIVMIWPLLTDMDEYRYAEIHDWVAAEAGKNGLVVADLVEVFSAYDYRDLQVTSEDNVHPNGRGHVLAASKAREMLVASGLLPSSGAAD